jgi:hypothetical protein
MAKNNGEVLMGGPTSNLVTYVLFVWNRTQRLGADMADDVVVSHTTASIRVRTENIDGANFDFVICAGRCPGR